MATMIDLAGEVLLDMLSHPTRAWLAQVGQRRVFADGELIHNRGDTAEAMGIVIAGQVRLVRLGANGSQTFVSVINEGQHFGDIVLLGSYRRTHDAFAVGAVAVDYYDQAAFDLIQGNAEVIKALYRITALRLGGSMSMSDDLRSLPREVHLAKVLLALWRRGDGVTSFSCTQDDLASLLGISMMSLSKHLGTLKQLGLIETGYRQVRIIDPEYLRAWVRERIGPAAA